MKKGITVESEYDVEGRWCLKLRKAKGKFTLDEIIEAAKAKVLIYFEALKKDYNEMITAITELSAEDDKEKFTTAVYKMLQLLADNIR